MRWLDDIQVSMDMSLSKIPKLVKDREAWHPAVRDRNYWATELNWRGGEGPQSWENEGLAIVPDVAKSLSRVQLCATP